MHHISRIPKIRNFCCLYHGMNYMYECPSTAWQASTIMLEMTCGILVLVSLISILAMCFKDFITKQTARVCGLFQAPAGTKSHAPIYSTSQQHQKYVYAATLARFTGFYLLRYPRERFENLNICIFHTFQETVGCHLLKSQDVQWLLLVMATLNNFNSNIFCGFSKQQSTCKNISIHQYKHILQPQLHSYEFY